MSTETIQLSGLVAVAGRYRKSVHLERDSHSEAALAGYVVTPLVRSVLDRLANSLQPDAPQRAWSITGPYGTGKSSFAVLWANLVAQHRDRHGEQARALLTAADPALAERIFGHSGPLFADTTGYATVLATGERAPLDIVILEALQRGLEGYWSGPGAKPGILRSIKAAYKRAAKGQPVGVRRIVELIETAARKVVESSSHGDGLVIVLDEAGKCLEYAAYEPARGDVQLLQELAEAANRSDDYPIVVITILHQAIERYAGRLGAAQRNEWAKVQGRFEDIAFQEDAEQLLRLVSAALVKRQELPRSTQRSYRQLARAVASTAQSSATTNNLAAELAELFPLHPATALILGPLFRTRLAQNERSLFSFLCSAEPLGFQTHLAQLISKTLMDNLYTVDQFYDYVVSALGNRLYGHDGRVWAEIDTALRRIPKDAEDVDARVLKTIGLLSLIGPQAGLRPSAEFLSLCIAGQTDSSIVKASLKRLTRASAIVYRKYRDAYQIWEGSDLDLDDLIRQAFDQIDTRADLSDRLAALVPPRPLVARRHLFKTGTLRYFEVRYVMADDVEEEMDAAPESEADGLLLFALPQASKDLSGLRALVQQPMLWFTHSSGTSKPVIVGFPRSAKHLANLATELSALEWVQTNTAELAKDPVARRELSARIAEVQRLIRQELIRLMDGSEDDGCEWYFGGKALPAASLPALGRQLSEVCDQVYCDAPHVRNELINRRQLSSAAAAARRNLLEAMLERADQERLGFEGFPPEVSIYESILIKNGIHRKSKKGEWVISRPTSKQDATLQPAWKAMESFLGSTEEKRRTVSELYEMLRQPPYGIKDGLLPIILCAALIHFDSDLAVYEKGGFVPGITTPVIERLLRSPDRFELQRFRIAGVRAQVFERFGRALLAGRDADRPTLLTIVKSLVQFIAELTPYARATKQVSQTAQNVRTTLKQAQEPGPLLFRELPKACGCQPFSTRRSADSKDVEQFFETLRQAIAELRVAYSDLLNEIAEQLADTFGIPRDATNLREELSSRSRRILNMAGEPLLKAFLIRTADDGLAYEEWLFSVATYLGSKPPDKWNDSNLEHMQVMLTRVARKFRALEALAVHVADDAESPHSLMRLSLTQPGLPEVERVVTVRKREARIVETLKRQLLDMVAAEHQGLSQDCVLAALAGAAQSVLDEDGDAPHKPGERSLNA